jgi:hypothetical protein
MARGKKRRQTQGTFALVEPCEREPDGASSLALSSGERASRYSPEQIAERLAAAQALRQLRVGFNPDKQAYRDGERQFAERLSKQLQELLAEFASSHAGWGEMLRRYATSPTYAISNMISARAQLARKGVRPDGLILSPTQWKNLGRRVKPEFFRVYKRLAADGLPDFDDTYLCEMLAPNVVVRTEKVTLADGSEEERERRFVVGFRCFDAYHEDATEPLPGQPELPSPSWFQATGSEEDAAKLWEDVKRICEWQDIELELEDAPADRRHGQALPIGAGADFDRERRRLRVRRAASMADQATSALGALLEAFGPAAPPADDEQAKARILARESAKYAISSLYGLASERQSFAFLSDVAADEKTLKAVVADVHELVKQVLDFLDPAMRMRARGEEERAEQFASRRRTRRRQGARARRSALAG